MQLPDVDIVMIQHDLATTPQVALPNGYSMRPYRDGDIPVWVAVQNAADPYFVATAESFTETMPGNTQYLAERVLFLVDPTGNEIGSIAGWNDSFVEDREIGHIHWVAIIEAAQGRGLAKPMLSAACAVMQRNGYNEAYLETNTRRLPAINLYLQFGFVPYVQNETQREAWRAVAPYLKHPLSLF
jgi:ribosomal protein S18 acetylase RimI-like enzyme